LGELITKMKHLEYMKEYGHEQLVFCNEISTGLKSLIAIHDTTLGPSCGGVRVWPYKNETEAAIDVLRLSRAMTYKSAAAGIPLGGGKAVIIADSRKDKNEALLRAFGKHVDTLGGRYITTEDVGMTPADLEFIAEETNHVVGLPQSSGGSGDTSEMTGLGVYLGMKAAAKSKWGDDNLNGKTVVFQGFGNVAYNTALHLIKEKAQLIASDINPVAVQKAQLLGIKTIDPDDIFETDMDIFSPCALGGILNDETIPRLKCSIIAGGANNQLLDTKHGYDLHKRKIIYAPDYIINAGGIINASCEVGMEYNEQRSKTITEKIYYSTLEVISISNKQSIPTSIAADQLAETRINSVRSIKNI
jgi:leucine dehydrogenase